MRKQSIINNKKIYWANFLHLYQPPWQKKEIVEEFANKSYRYILGILKKHPKVKITLNISGCLTEQLVNYGFRDILEDIKKLALKGQIELVGSAMYHPILPLIPEDKIIRQIKLNEDVNSKVFGKAWKISKKRYGLKGFFMPEMAYSKKVAKLISKLGFNWIILDEIAYNGHLNRVDFNKKYKISNLDLNTIFRTRKLYIYGEFPPKSLLKNLRWIKKKCKYIVSASDGEGYLNNPDKNKYWVKSLKDKNIKTLTCSEYLNSINNIKEINPIESSWESTEKEIKDRNPFTIWNSKNNEIHGKLWDLNKKIRLFIKKNENDRNFKWMRYHSDRSLSSCTWWWADGRFHGYNPEEIERGLLEMIKVARSSMSCKKNTRIEFEKMYSKIIYLIWKKHWEKIK